MPRLVIVSEFLTHYRVPFFERLRARLGAAGVELVLVHGQAPGDEATRRDEATLPWAHTIRNRHLRLARRALCWQPAWRWIEGADLVVVEQASRMLFNYVLFGAHALGRQRMAFWGHGRSFRPAADAAAERLKQMLSRRVHWWFAYNDRSARVVADLGFPEARITDVRNAIDTTALVERKQQLSVDDLAALRARLGLEGENVGVFVGGMYAEKRLPFLIEACQAVRQRVPDFEMLFVGAGPEAPAVETAARAHDWLHYVGPKLGPEAVPYLLLAKLVLMPGLVGLAVLDSLALGLPLVTTAVPFHSPEIDYLRDGHNGVIVPDPADPAAYADAVATLLRDDARRQALAAGCHADAPAYSIDGMADRFAGGVLQALSAPHRGGRVPA